MQTYEKRDLITPKKPKNIESTLLHATALPVADSVAQSSTGKSPLPHCSVLGTCAAGGKGSVTWKVGHFLYWPPVASLAT